MKEINKKNAQIKKIYKLMKMGIIDDLEAKMVIKHLMKEINDLKNKKERSDSISVRIKNIFRKCRIMRNK